jgi:unsaturated rhamnogalacturonyl hydrolase
MKIKVFSLIILLLSQSIVFSQQAQPNDATTPLHMLRPDYPVPYGIPRAEEVTAYLNRIHAYLDGVTPTGFINSTNSQPVTDLAKLDQNTILSPGDFRIVSYEWGVAYAGMLAAGEATGDPRFKDYTEKRLQFIAESAPFFQKTLEEHADWGTRLPLRNLVAPRALDDCGAMCTAMIKAKRGGSRANLDPLIQNSINYIMTKEHRLGDGTLARMRPQPNTMWLDDLFMGLPALAQMGKLTGEKKYFDEAAKQLLAYSKRMFNKEKGVYMHGWVEGMTEHPEMYWARANGWAFMTEAEILDVLPENHPRRAEILALLRAHAKGLASYQSGTGFWHQLLNHEDSYLETSATAIYTYAYARAINRKWIDPAAYAPMTFLAWNAVSSKINQKGQVEGTCVGTGLGFDPAFYYYRPVSPFAAHGYGPTLLAGAEILTMLKNYKFEINDSTVQLLQGK